MVKVKYKVGEIKDQFMDFHLGKKSKKKYFYAILYMMAKLCDPTNTFRKQRFKKQKSK